MEHRQDQYDDQERCLRSLVSSIEQLQGHVDLAQLSKICDLIIQTMTGPWRFFHTTEHIFEVGGSSDAVEILAALFHDLVYVQVDQVVNINISGYISPFIKDVHGHLTIRDCKELPPDRMFEIVMAVFGFTASQPLAPMAGQNEFLSALIALKTLESMLSLEHLVEIATCIEATIPFRPRKDGDTPSDRLYQRLTQVNQTLQLGWGETRIIEAIQRSVRVANRDVENFAHSNSDYFLSNTWNLMPETNHHLRANFYTVQEYRQSLQKMEGFMNFLQPEAVFQEFRGEPGGETYQDLVKRTRKNIEVAKLYLGSKLVSIAIIEALSLRIGQDIPISTMMGELPSKGYTSAQLEQFIPNILNQHPLKDNIEHEVLDLLEIGRKLDSSYDVKNSPTATFIVKSVGFEQVRILCDRAKEFFKNEISPEVFLAHCDACVLQTIVEGVAQLFDRRKEALLRPAISHSSKIFV
jgi:hypothetical protein